MESIHVPTGYDSMTADGLLNEYRRLAIAHGTAKDPETGNNAHDRLVQVRLALRDSGQIRRILELLDDPDEHVRGWAGFDALYIEPGAGEPVLRALAQGPRGIVRFNAAMTLELWETGELVLYPWETDE